MVSPEETPLSCPCTDKPTTGLQLLVQCRSRNLSIQPTLAMFGLDDLSQSTPNKSKTDFDMKTSIFKYFRRVAILGNCRCSLRACKSGTTSGRIHPMSANKLSSPFLASQWYSEAGAVTEQATAAATCLGLLTRMRFCMLGCKFGANFFLCWGGFLWTVHISLGSWREGFANHYYFEIEKVCFQKN